MTSPDSPDPGEEWYLSDDEPGHLDGHTIEELSDYLDRGRIPTDRSIEHSPSCRIALASLERLRGAMGTMLQNDVDRAPVPDDRWVSAIMGAIVFDARSGRDIPISHSAPNARLTVTEGAVRGLVRAAGDRVDNLIVGRCRLDGDVTVPGTPITITVDASVYKGERIPALADELRNTLLVLLHAHTELIIAAIDVIIRDIYLSKPDIETGQKNL